MFATKLAKQLNQSYGTDVFFVSFETIESNFLMSLQLTSKTIIFQMYTHVG